MGGLDADGRGTAAQPFRASPYAVNHLPYDENNIDSRDPMQGANPSSATVPDRINIHTGVYGFYDTTHTIAENIVVDGLHLTQAVVIRSYNWVIANGQPQPDPSLANRDNTIVNVKMQNIDQVIEVSENCVTIQGLGLMGAPVGVYADQKAVYPFIMSQSRTAGSW